MMRFVVNSENEIKELPESSSYLFCSDVKSKVCSEKNYPKIIFEIMRKLEVDCNLTSYAQKGVPVWYFRKLSLYHDLLEFLETVDICKHLSTYEGTVHWVNPPACFQDVIKILNIQNIETGKKKGSVSLIKSISTLPYALYSVISSLFEMLSALVARFRGKKNILYITSPSSFLVWDGKSYHDVNQGLLDALRKEDFHITTYMELSIRSFDPKFLKFLTYKTAISEFLFTPLYFCPFYHFNIETAISGTSYEGTDISSFLNKMLRKKRYVDLIVPKLLLSILSPIAIIERGGYNRRSMTFNLIAKKRQIPTIDLQHGIIHSQSPYLYPGVDPNLQNPLPQYSFVFGQHFKDIFCNDGRLPEPNIVVAGSPYVKFKQTFVTSQKDILNLKNKSGPTVVITSQPLTTDYVISFVGEVAKRNKQALFLIKAHPREKTERYEEKFRQTPNVKLMPKKYDIHDALSIADLHLTCWSTCTYEAILCGLKTVLIPHAFSSIFKTLVDEGICILVNSPDIVDQAIKNPSRLKKEQIENYYSSKDPYATVLNFLKKKSS
jgi:hypothetical protein